jgi:predicted nucleic acid-binding protein/GNAT superfamily N-acetyltransferase
MEEKIETAYQSKRESMKVVIVNHHFAYLEAVKDLWRKNSQTLGFFPEGAFNEHAARGWILAAISDPGEVCGYLLYRVVWRGSVWPIGVIVHLCVKEEFRRKGVSRILLDQLMKSRREGFLKLQLSCRRGYPANAVWPRLGFTYGGEITGRAGFPLMKWQMILRDLPIITLIEQNQAQRQLQAVIDANVLYRLQDPLPTHPVREKRLSEEAKALEADWIREEIGLCITDETLNEIQENEDPNRRRFRLSASSRYSNLRTNVVKVREVEQKVEPFFSSGGSRSTKSDIRQIAHAVAGNAHFFITQDKGVLNKAEKLSYHFGLRILSPGEFIAHLDESISEIEYRPESLAGSKSLVKEKVSDRGFTHVCQKFRRPDFGEKKTDFEGMLRFFLAHPTLYEIQIISQGGDEDALALLVFDRTNVNQLVLTLLRIAGSKLGETVLRYLLRGAVLTSVKEGRSLIMIMDKTIPADFNPAFVEAGFLFMNGAWIKFSLSKIHSGSDLIDLLTETEQTFSPYRQLFVCLGDTLSRAMERRDAIAFAELERQLWPGKIIDANLSNYIVPIQPGWARNLFDESLAKDILWGSQEHLSLMLRNENVYYRSARSNPGIASPARILWYVSKGIGYQGTKSIRGCSALDEVIVGPARDLYRRFKRLGVYRWTDILSTAKGTPSENIMALRFSNTQLFTNPVTLNSLRDILLKTEGKEPFIQSPQPISPSSFQAIYEMATLS